MLPPSIGFPPICGSGGSGWLEWEEFEVDFLEFISVLYLRPDQRNGDDYRPKVFPVECWPLSCHFQVIANLCFSRKS